MTRGGVVIETNPFALAVLGAVFIVGILLIRFRRPLGWWSYRSNLRVWGWDIDQTLGLRPGQYSEFGVLIAGVMLTTFVVATVLVQVVSL